MQFPKKRDKGFNVCRKINLRQMFFRNFAQKLKVFFVHNMKILSAV